MTSSFVCDLLHGRRNIKHSSALGSWCPPLVGDIVRVASTLTFGMFGLPSLHCQLVFLKFMAPVRVDLSIVSFCRGSTGLSIDGEVVAAECAN